jgi:hypothetical protein
MVDETAAKTAAIEPRQPTKLRWGDLSIREYNRTVGDHPEVAVGPPLTFTWEYLERDPVSLDEYESNRAPKKRILRLSSITRKNLLRTVFEASEEDILQSEKEIQLIRKQRQQSKQSKKGDKAKGALKSARRKLFGRFSREHIMKGLSAASGSGLWLSMSA